MKFRAHIRVGGAGLRVVEARLDGRRIKVTGRSLLGFNIHVGRLRRKTHVLTVGARDRAGHSVSRSVRFRRCRRTR